MPDLVSMTQVLAYLGPGMTDDDGLIALLVEGVEAKLEADCGRADRPFSRAQTARVERKDAFGGSVLYLDYPIAALTSITLGYDPLSWDETLDLTDVEVVQFGVGERRIVRGDGGSFGIAGQARTVVVTYNAAEDLPKDCALAVLRGVAILYGQRGSEDVKNEQVGGYSADMSALDEDPLWKATVERHREPML